MQRRIVARGIGALGALVVFIGFHEAAGLVGWVIPAIVLFIVTVAVVSVGLISSKRGHGSRDD